MAKKTKKKTAKAKDKKLTNKQQCFVDEYLIDLNATQAAIRAGYSEKTARQTGTENLSKPVIAKAIDAATRKRSERTKIDADWVLKRLANEAEADMSELYNDDGSIKKIHDWPLVFRQGLVSGMDVDEITVAGVKIGVTTKLKLSERIKRIELIGKHVDVQAFRERHEHVVEGGVLVAPAGMTPEQWILEEEKANTNRTAPDKSGKD